MLLEVVDETLHFLQSQHYEVEDEEQVYEVAL